MESERGKRWLAWNELPAPMKQKKIRALRLRVEYGERDVTYPSAIAKLPASPSRGSSTCIELARSGSRSFVDARDDRRAERALRDAMRQVVAMAFEERA